MTTIDQIDAFDTHERIKSSLKKKSDEYRVLATLRYYDHDRFNQWKCDDAPDLQKTDGSEGIEVTTTENREADFQFQCIRKENKKEPKNEKKISTAKKIIQKNGKDINGVSVNGQEIFGLTETSTSNGLLDAISKSIDSKNGKITGYKKKCRKIGLAIIVDQITIDDDDLLYELANSDGVFNKSLFDTIYLLTLSELIMLDKKDKKLTRKCIPKNVHFRIKKLSRMTAEALISPNDSIWEIIHSF